jgi:hypothetical protein
MGVRQDHDKLPDDDDERDEQLLAELKGVLAQVDPVPGHVTAAARAALGWRTLDEDLADLLYDSSEELEPVGVRGEDQPRMLSFRGPSLGLDVEISGSGADRTLTGQVLPAGPAQIVVRHTTGALELEADARGRFVAAGVPAGTVSLSCRSSEARHSRPLLTPWLPI